ncbi:MAG: DEAD/DEAH box helicase family protein [Chloroflexi bacterium]|nr:DEAD/DEAH box helicase family protein [Chloroflexota bacterium]
MNLSELLDRYGESLSQAVIDTYPPLYDAEVRRIRNPDLRRLLRRPLGGQGDAISGTVLSLQRHSGTIVVGEMGTGKSYIAAAAAYLDGHRRILIVCPPHLVKKWRREIVQTVPGAQVAIIRTIGDLEEIRRSEGTPQFVICSRERAKLGYRWVPAVVHQPVRGGIGFRSREDDGQIATLLSCPSCFTAAVDDEGVPLCWAELRAKKRACHACGGPLWQADRTGPRRVALADYLRRRMKGVFDLLIVDEAHEFKARGSAQGLAAEALAGACRKCLILTGTLFGGCARRHWVT